MNTITAILEADEDGTLHVPLPEELRHGRIEITATLRPANALAGGPIADASEKVARRKAALKQLRELGGLSDVIPDPVTWQRDQRLDRPLPGRD